MRAFQEAGVDGVVEEREERAPVAEGVQQSHRFGVNAELGPGENLAELIKGAIAAWHSDERIGEIGHESFALMHGFDDAEIGESAVGDFAVDEGGGDDSDDFAAVSEGGVGERAHESDIGATVVEADAVVCDCAA